MDETFAQTLARLDSAQKGAARSAPAYSRFVNRRLGRFLAAWAYRRGLSPNAVTGISALFTFAGIALLVACPPSGAVGVAVSLLLVLGYAFDSADGQVARLTGTGSSAGEWLDHMVDATKIVVLPLALMMGLHRFGAPSELWLLVPVANAIVGSVLFFGMILTEQLRRAHGVRSAAATGGRLPWLRSVLVVPTDYGLLCLSFLLYGDPSAFLPVYGALTLATAGYLLLALPKWFREIAALTRTSVPT
ncbi:CDP-alcohol phosphatidyltransferase [mine drainage metagenome]|uniref:CDP-alcohol phosphatidyltransferase n=1 Tax=mine drainage metagenome TaxID=410659 RepID=A0A1J5RU45_9ZZZZ